MGMIHKAVLCAALSAASVLGAAAPASAQATKVASGSGSFVSQSGPIHAFSFTVLVLPDGTIQGSAQVMEPSSGAIVQMQVTSFQFVGDTLAMAGPITQASNAPPWMVVGATAFFGVHDNGDGTSVADDITGLGVVPPAFGNLTIQQIIGLLGPPPPQAFSPLVTGDIRID